MSLAPDQSSRSEPFRPQLRIGAAIRRRGGAQVRVVEAEAADAQAAQWQPLTRAIEESALADAGLFETRSIDIAERGEALVIAKPLHLREELRLHKSIREHVEHVDGRLRRTEVEIEDLAPADGDAPRLP